MRRVGSVLQEWPRKRATTGIKRQRDHLNHLGDGPMMMMMSRWTDGEAVLPLPAMRGPVVLEIQLAGAMTFVEDAVPVGEAERHTAA